MSCLVDLVFKELSHLAELKKLRSEGEKKVLFLKLKSRYERVKHIVSRILEEVGRRGEVISVEGGGEVIDIGEKSLSVRRALVSEVYDYEEMSTAFLRLYEFEDEFGRIWSSVYVDYDSKSLWWE